VSQTSQEFRVALMDCDEMTVFGHQFQHVVVLLRILRVQSFKGYLRQTQQFAEFALFIFPEVLILKVY